jgi:hypothetical protein
LVVIKKEPIRLFDVFQFFWGFVEFSLSRKLRTIASLAFTPSVQSMCQITTHWISTIDPKPHATSSSKATGAFPMTVGFLTKPLDDVLGTSKVRLSGFGVGLKIENFECWRYFETRISQQHPPFQRRDRWNKWRSTSVVLDMGLHASLATC